MPNTGCLEGLRCPECGSLGPFDIRVSLIAEFSDDGGIGDIKTQDIEWEDDSFCACLDCPHEGTIASFTNESDEEDDEPEPDVDDLGPIRQAEEEGEPNERL